MGRISRSFELVKASWTVLKADRELLALPVMSAIASIVIASTFVVPIFLTTDVTAETTRLTPVQYVLLFLMYVVLAYVTIFFNAALVHAANQRMDGGDPTLGTALRGAASLAVTILPWAIVSATVSVVLRAIEERAGFVGRIVVGLIGLAWTLVTYLVLPILVLERLSVGDAIKESAAMFKRTWGENVTAQLGFGLIGFLAAIPAIAVGVLAAGMGGAVAVVGISVAVLTVIVIAVVLVALNGIFQTALYRFARTGTSGGAFDDTLLSQTFVPRNKRGLI
jgi:hypothetical protein